MLIATKPISSMTGIPINGWSISSSTMIFRTPRMHRGPDGVVFVTADVSISFALHFCLSLLPLIAMFSMMGSGNTSTLRGKPRFFASSTELRGIAEYSKPVSANSVTLTPRFSAIRLAVWTSLLSAIAPLLPKVLVRLLRVGIPLYLVL
jgi:hypothetical protein